jgi:YD repeat-containing protein
MIKLLRILALFLIPVCVLVLSNNSVLAQTPIIYGQTVTGSISAAAEIDEFTFAGTIGDKITIRFARTNGTFLPYVELLNSSGTQITSSNSGLIDATLSATETLKIAIRDNDTTNTGDYSLSIQCVNNPTGGAALAFGQTVTGNIDSFAKIITYTITAEANDTLRVAYARLTQSSGSFDFNLELYNSAGDLVMSSSDGLLETTAVSAGIYSLLVTDYSRNGTGTYELTLQRSNNPAGAIDAIYDAVIEDSIGTVTQFKVYKVTALAQDVITFCSAVKQGTANFDVYAELFDTAGNRLISNIGSVKHTFTDSGTFYLFISDYNRDGTGIFKYTLIKSDIDCSTIDLVNPQVTLNTPKPEEVVEIGSLYNITWVSSDNFGVTWQEIRLSTDSGISYPSVIATNLTGNVQSYEWSVPENSASTHSRIMITARDAKGNEGTDSTEEDFFILNTTLPADAVNVTYQYDNENRLIQSSLNGTPKETYTYDAAGNRLNLNAN